MKFLVETHKLLKDDHVTRPIRTPKDEELLEVHTKLYLESLNSSYNVAAITEMPFIAIMPNFLGADPFLPPILRPLTSGHSAIPCPQPHALRYQWHDRLGNAGGAERMVDQSWRWLPPLLRLPGRWLLSLF